MVVKTKGSTSWKKVVVPEDLSKLGDMGFGSVSHVVMSNPSHPDYKRVQAEHRRRVEAKAKADAATAAISASFSMELGCKWAL